MHVVSPSCVSRMNAAFIECVEPRFDTHCCDPFCPGVATGDDTDNCGALLTVRDVAIDTVRSGVNMQETTRLSDFTRWLSRLSDLPSWKHFDHAPSPPVRYADGVA
jgi:hypothetical protein